MSGWTRERDGGSSQNICLIGSRIDRQSLPAVGGESRSPWSGKHKQRFTTLRRHLRTRGTGEAFACSLQYSSRTIADVECLVTPEREPTIATAASTKLSAPQPPAEPGRPLVEHGPLDDARFAPGHIFASRYRIVNLLGRGAMGEAYRAEDLKLGQPVAIKLLGVGGARRWDVQRFTSEVRLARTISHPNVCRVYDIGEADGWWYVPMAG